jgi:DNA-binding NarL/FixJ family response regulator
VDVPGEAAGDGGRSTAAPAPLRTVLVDDVEELRHVMRSLLSRDGRFEVVGEAANGSDAIDLVVALQPDLVVLDVTMPVLDGLAALPRLRAGAPGTSVVMLSGLPAEEMEAPSIAGGAVGYLEKGGDMRALPAQLHALVAVLEAVQHVLDATYAADTASPRKVRADLRTALRTEVDQDALDVIELLTTELVTNAVRHASSTARVAAAVTGSRIRVSVTDDGPGMPVQRVAKPDDEGGRGLGMVEALASDWGVDVVDDGGGTTVWFETLV